MNRTNGKDIFESIPGVVFELLVAEAEAAAFLVYLKNLDFDVGADLSELARVFDFLGPAEVADMDKTVDTFFDFNKYAEVGEVAHAGSVTAADGIANLDVFPGIFLELLQAKAHLAVGTVESEDDSLDFVADFEEVLSRAEVLAVRHLADVDKTLDAGGNLNECAVVGHYNYAAFDMVADLKLGIESVPGMGLELLQAESDALLLVVEIEDNDVELLVELDNFLRMVDTAPREVGDVDETVDTAQVDEYAVGGDVLDGSFENLTLFELGDDFALLLFEFGLDECLVADNNVLEFLIDLDNLEFHCLAHKDVVVADRLHVDLRAGEECLDAEYIDDHATLGAAFDVAFDDLVVLESRVDAVPRTCSTSFAVRQDQLAFLVFLVFDEHFHLIAHFDFGVVAEFAHGNDTVALVADVNNHLTFVDGDDCTFDYVFVFYGVEALVVGLDEFFTRFVAPGFAMFVGVPVEVCNGCFYFFSH